MKKLFYLISILSLIIIISPLLVLGAEEYTPLVTLPGVTTVGTEVTLDTYLPGLYRLAIALSFVLAVVIIIFGGLQYMSTDAVSGKKEGRDRINQALIGLLLVISSYLILQTINPNLVNFNLNFALPDPPPPTKLPELPQRIYCIDVRLEGNSTVVKIDCFENDLVGTVAEDKVRYWQERFARVSATAINPQFCIGRTVTHTGKVMGRVVMDEPAPGFSPLAPDCSATSASEQEEKLIYYKNQNTGSITGYVGLTPLTGNQGYTKIVPGAAYKQSPTIQ